MDSPTGIPNEPQKARLGLLGAIGAVAVVYLFATLVGCLPLRDSPFSDTLTQPERDLNGQALKRLDSDMKADGKIRIAIFADAHENYDDLDMVLKQINATPDVDFIVNLGDITNFAMNAEYDHYLKSQAVLQRPTLTVIGNHDAIGAGPELFRKAFGVSNYYFERNGFRFIFWNSVNLEDPESFDPDWLFRTVDESTLPIVIFSHVALNDEERLPADLRAKLAQMEADSRVLAVINGHLHGYDFKLNTDGTMRLTVPRVEDVRWVILDMEAGGFSITRVETGETQWAGYKPSSGL